MITKEPKLNKGGTSVLVSDNASQALFARIRGDIESGKLQPGDRLQPVRELSDVYNLSFEAVRKVIKRLASLELVIQKRGSGTYVATQDTYLNHAATITNTTILMMDSYEHIKRDIAESIVENIQDDGIECVRYARNSSSESGIPDGVYKAIAKWKEHPPRAVVVNWSDVRLFNALEELSALGTRVIVLFANPMLFPQWDYVGFNAEMLADLATTWLLDRGHQRVGVVTHRRHISQRDPSSKRKRTVGTTAIITELGHSLREKTGRKGGLTILYNYAEDGKGLAHNADPLLPHNIDNAVQWLSQPNRPTAVVGPDFRLVGIIHAAEKMGLRIPEDLELLGIGNTPWSKAYKFKSISLNEPIIADHIARLIKEPNSESRESTNRIFVSPSLDGV